MPELPEVETLKLGLQKYIVGKIISDVEVRDPKLVTGSVEQIIEAIIIGVRRRAKGIILDLSNGYSIAFHIKLTGQLIFRDEKTKELPVMKPTPMTVPNKFTRVVFILGGSVKGKGESYLYFQEVRGFAWMKVVKTSEVLEMPFFKSLGPDIISSEGSGSRSAKASRDKQARMTDKMFERIVQSSNIPIKALLMDQKKMGGIGNIYANDSCFEARIDPRRKAKTLSLEEMKTLYESLLKVLHNAFQYRGSSELNFVDVLGQMGEYQKHFLVYGRTNKPCIREDGGMIQRVELAGRGTFFCPVCQK